MGGGGGRSERQGVPSLNLGGIWVTGRSEGKKNLNKHVSYADKQHVCNKKQGQGLTRQVAGGNADGQGVGVFKGGKKDKE